MKTTIELIKNIEENNKNPFYEEKYDTIVTVDSETGDFNSVGECHMCGVTVTPGVNYGLTIGKNIERMKNNIFSGRVYCKDCLKYCNNINQL